MITIYDTPQTSEKKSHLQVARSGIVLGLAVLVGSVCAYSQSQEPILTDAQAISLLQTLAKGQGAWPTISAAQLRLLSQYAQQQSKSASSGANLAQARLITQVAALQGRAVTTNLPGSEFAQPASQLAATPSSATGVTPAMNQKKPATLRIGVTEPKAQMGQGNSGANTAGPLQAMLIHYLNGPGFDVVPITAMLPIQIEGEAAQKECDYVLYSSITQKMNSGSAGLLHKAMPMMSLIPMVGPLAGMAGVMAGSAAGVAVSGAAGLSSNIKAKSEVSFDYKVTAPGNATPVISNNSKAKAKEDGEDIVSPLIEQAAGVILTVLSQKK